MPIHDVGYRSWDGKRTSQFSRWWIICETGIRLSAKSAWVRRILLAAWLPVMYWGVGFFFLEKTIEAENNSIISTALAKLDGEIEIPSDVIETIKGDEIQEALRDALPVPDVVPDFIVDQAIDQALEQTEDVLNNEEVKRAIAEASKKAQEKGNKALESIDGIEVGGTNEIKKMLEERFSMFPHADSILEAIETKDPERIRKDVWRWMMMIFFRYPQSLLILFLIGIVAPSLISRDLRSRAFLLYFSRPIGKIEYIAGKLCIPAVFIAAVTTLPALALYLFAIMMSPNLGVFWSTWDIPIRIIIATFALVIPTSSIALMLSSLTHESRFANFSWFAVWALGHGAWIAIVLATAIGMGKPPFHPEVVASAQVQNWSVLSLYNCLGDVQEFIFGFETLENVWRGTAAIFLVTVFSLSVLYRRVSAPTQV